MTCKWTNSNGKCVQALTTKLIRMGRQFSSLICHFQFNLTYKNELIDKEVDVSQSLCGWEKTLAQNEWMNEHESESKSKRKKFTEFCEMKNIIWFALDQITHSAHVFLALCTRQHLTLSIYCYRILVAETEFFRCCCDRDERLLFNVKTNKIVYTSNGGSIDSIADAGFNVVSFMFICKLVVDCFAHLFDNGCDGILTFTYVSIHSTQTHTQSPNICVSNCSTLNRSSMWYSANNILIHIYKQHFSRLFDVLFLIFTTQCQHLFYFIPFGMFLVSVEWESFDGIEMIT